MKDHLFAISKVNSSYTEIGVRYYGYVANNYFIFQDRDGFEIVWKINGEMFNMHFRGRFQI